MYKRSSFEAYAVSSAVLRDYKLVVRFVQECGIRLLALKRSCAGHSDRYRNNTVSERLCHSLDALSELFGKLYALYLVHVFENKNKIISAETGYKVGVLLSNDLYTVAHSVKATVARVVAVDMVVRAKVVYVDEHNRDSLLSAGFLPVEYAEGMVDRWEKVLAAYGIDRIQMLNEDGTPFKVIYRQ